MSLPNWVSYHKRRAFSAAGHARKALLRLARGPDLETLRRRALDGARGEIVREGATYRASGVTHWHVRRAIAGRVDQFEFVANGRVRLTSGRRGFPFWARPERKNR